MTVTLPGTRYARAGEAIRIAYQVHGEGPLDLVAVYGPAAQPGGGMGEPDARRAS